MPTSQQHGQQHFLSLLLWVAFHMLHQLHRPWTAVDCCYQKQSTKWSRCFLAADGLITSCNIRDQVSLLPQVTSCPAHSASLSWYISVHHQHAHITHRMRIAQHLLRCKLCAEVNSWEHLLGELISFSLLFFRPVDHRGGRAGERLITRGRGQGEKTL